MKPLQNVLFAGNTISPINEVRGSRALIQMEMYRNGGVGGGVEPEIRVDLFLSFFLFLHLFAVSA